MTNPKKFFADNVNRQSGSEGQNPIGTNEQKGFLAMCEVLENIQSQLNQIEYELSALRQEVHSQ